MNAGLLVEKLRRTADILQPFTRPPRPGALVWNGTAYVPSSDGSFDPYALSWWGILTTAADLIDAQGHPISTAQRDYLERMLFGGMGSLSDFMLNVSRFGEGAREVNAQLDRARKDLFDEFRVP